MRICDITREDEVVGHVLLVVNHGEGDNEQELVFEVGKRALDAFKTGAWGALQTMTPPALRVKDAKKAAAGKKAAATRAAGKGQKATSTPEKPPAAPAATTGTNAAPSATESSSGAPGGSSDDAIVDPGF